MIPDSEVISLMCTVLTRLDVGEFTVKVSPLFYSHAIVLFLSLDLFS